MVTASALCDYWLQEQTDKALACVVSTEGEERVPGLVARPGACSGSSAVPNNGKTQSLTSGPHGGLGTPNVTSVYNTGWRDVVRVVHGLL